MRVRHYPRGTPHFVPSRTPCGINLAVQLEDRFRETRHSSLLRMRGTVNGRRILWNLLSRRRTSETSCYGRCRLSRQESGWTTSRFPTSPTARRIFWRGGWVQVPESMTTITWISRSITFLGKVISRWHFPAGILTSRRLRKIH